MNSKVDYLIKNNLKWEINFSIPIQTIQTKRRKFIAAIHLNHIPKQKIYAINLRTNKHFVLNVLPVKITINEKYINDPDIDQILLHELNHWFTYEVFGRNIQPHGKEFKKCGKFIGLSKKYNSAHKKADKQYIHVGKCSCCGKKVCAVKTKTQFLKYKEKYVTKCCHADIIYDNVYYM